MYPKSVLTAANVDRGCYTDVNVNLWGLYVGCSVKEAPSLFVKFFSPAGFSCKATRMFEDTLHHPYILLVFAENILYILTSIGAQLRQLLAQVGHREWHEHTPKHTHMHGSTNCHTDVQVTPQHARAHTHTHTHTHHPSIHPSICC